MLRWIESGSDLGALSDPSLVGFPLHVGDLTLGSNVWLWITVTLQAPLHRNRLDDPNDLHLVDTAVTRCAANAGAQMGAVIEERVVRKLVDANPRNRLIGLPALPHRR